MTGQGGHRFLIGWRKWLLYLRVAAHVAIRGAANALRGRMPARKYPVFLYRALLFLLALRHSKAVGCGGRWKLHLYIPAYPSRAFWHTLGKLCRPEPGPVSVVLSMTRACSYRCPHCYQRRDEGRDLDMETLISAARSMQDLGVSLFDIEGGEPLARFDRLVGLLRSLDDRAETWINTTGVGLTEAQADELLGAGLFGAMVSLHAPDAAAHDAFTGVPGSFEAACRALRLFARRGAFTAINCCPDPAAVEGGGLERLLDLGRELDCAFVCRSSTARRPEAGWAGPPGSAAAGGASTGCARCTLTTTPPGGCCSTRRSRPRSSRSARTSSAAPPEGWTASTWAPAARSSPASS
jgi:hypothetical protein